LPARQSHPAGKPARAGAATSLEADVSTRQPITGPLQTCSLPRDRIYQVLTIGWYF
jgi:hypothetical protein